MPGNMIKEIEEYSERTYKMTRDAFKSPPKPGDVITLDFVLKLTMDDSVNDELERELKRLERVYTSR